MSEENTQLKSMIERIQDYLNTNVLLEYPASLERFSAELPSMRILQMKELTKQDVNILGEYTGIYTFGLELRIPKSLEPSFAYRLFMHVDDFLTIANTNKNFPELGNYMQCQRMNIASNPILQQRLEDGSEDYLAQYHVVFKKITNLN